MQGPNRQKPTTQEIIDCKRTYINENSLQECIICVETFKESQLLANLPCFHTFHDNCISNWIQAKFCCPVCHYCLFEYTDKIKVPLNNSKQFNFTNQLNSKTKQINDRLGLFITGSIPVPSNIQKTFVGFGNSFQYNGECKKDSDIRDGYGQQIWADGSIYEGCWKNDEKSGQGRFISANGEIYQGEWMYDKFNGFGTQIYSDGAQYNGDYVAGNRHGYGTYINADHSNYEGNWKDDLQNGNGKQTWQDGSEYYGCYVSSEKQGKGIYRWSNGNTYLGDWRNNSIDGNGIYLWSNGMSYCGQWVNNTMQGQGTYKWQDGRMYYGAYENDKKSGFGVYVRANGKAYFGNWTQGKQDSEIICIQSSGVIKKRLLDYSKKQKWTVVSEHDKECYNLILVDALKKSKEERKKEIDALPKDSKNFIGLDKNVFEEIIAKVYEQIG